MLLAHRHVHHARLRAGRWLRLRPRPRSRRRRWRWPPARALAALAAALLTTAATAPTGQVPPNPPHQPPVAAPVGDSFRPPAQPYGPGNRGIEYDTQPGTVVQASADGQVVFAGNVALTRHVTVLHPDGVRTSYSFLASVDVVVGQHVRHGDRLGLAGERLHFGARRGDAYFDPASLFATTVTEVELLPFEVPPAESADEERAALLALVNESGGGIHLPDVGNAARWVADRAAASVHYRNQLRPIVRGAALAAETSRRLLSPPPCTDRPSPPVPAATEDRVALLVGGLGSSSDSASIDELRVAELGYEPDEVVRFSYRGGRTPDRGAAFRGLEPSVYESADTQGDMRRSATRLADAVEAIAIERPDAVIDLFAHSMGGVVTRLALAELERRRAGLGHLGLVATLGSPHRGADLATAVMASGTAVAGPRALDEASQRWDTGLDPGSTAIRQLSETSDVVAELGEAGVPEGVELVSIAARADHVVAAPNTEVDGARNVTVSVRGPGAHGDLVASDAATRELALALAGMPPACESVADAVWDQVLGHGTSYAEDVAGAGVARLLG